MNSSTSDNQPASDPVETLAFVGEITASVTHELNNVIGTIEQVTGLVEDLIDTDQVREAGLGPRLESVLKRVYKQTERGSTLIKRLNGFAHLADEARSVVNLGDLLQSVIDLSRRKAGLRRVTLEIRDIAPRATLEASPLLAAQCLYGMIKMGFEVADPAHPLQVGLVADADELRVEITCETEAQSLPDSQPVAAICKKGLAGQLTIDQTDRTVRILMKIPCHT